MASARYKHYLIIGTGKYNSMQNYWKGSAAICWKVRYHQIHLLYPSSEFKTRFEAEHAAITTAQTWIDNFLAIATL